MKFDDVFHQIGTFGKYQVILLLWIAFLAGWPANAMSNIYFLMELPFWCSRDGTTEAAAYRNDTSNDTFMSETDVTVGSPNERTQCYGFTENTTEACSSWDFDHTEYGRTGVERFALVCGRTWLKSFANTIIVLGTMAGSIPLGQASDRFGRMRTVMVCGLAVILFWTISFMSPNYPLYAATRFLAAAAHIGVYANGYVYKLVAPTKRLLVGQLYNTGFNVGYMLLSGLAYAVKDGVYLETLCVAPFAFLLCFSVLAPESPRWLLVNDQYAKASKILNRIKQVNNKGPADEKVNVNQLSAGLDEPTGSMVDVFKSKILLKRALILICHWMSVNLIWYALIYNSAALIPGNFYINNFLLAIVGLPATVIGYVLNGWKRTGRRLTCSLMMIFPGVIGFISIPCTIYKFDTALRILSITGKMFIGAAFDAVYLFTAESFPTEVRSSAFGLCSTCGRVGSILATFAGRELASIWLPLPYAVFGLFGTISGALILLLPETLNRKLSETIQEVEEQYQSSESAKEEKVAVI